jgi:hypothetical protein
MITQSKMLFSLYVLADGPRDTRLLNNPLPSTLRATEDKEIRLLTSAHLWHNRKQLRFVISELPIKIKFDEGILALQEWNVNCPSATHQY